MGEKGEKKNQSSLFEVAGLRPYADRHVAACVEVAPLNSYPGAARNGPLRRLDPGEVRSLGERGNKNNFIFIVVDENLHNFICHSYANMNQPSA